MSSWKIQSDYKAIGDDQISEPRSLRGLALSPDGTKLYGGFIRGTTSASLRRVASAIIPGTIQNGSPLIERQMLVWTQAKGLATDSRGNVFATHNPTGPGTDLTFGIYTADLAPIATVTSHTALAAELSGIAVAKIGQRYYVYLSRRGALATIERWDVTTPTNAKLDTNWANNGRVDLKTRYPGAFCNGLDIDADGTLYVTGGTVSDSLGDAIFKIPANGNLAGLKLTRLLVPMDVAVAGAYLYVAQYLGPASTVAVLDKATLTTVGIKHTGIPHPNMADDSGYSGIVVDSAGRIFVSDQVYEEYYDPVPPGQYSHRIFRDRVLVFTP